jgi:hypothetical protein
MSKRGVSFMMLCLLTGLVNCGNNGKSFMPKLPGYDASQKKVLILDKDLVEISGLFYLDTDKIASINDEEGKLFFINPADGSYTVTKFGRKRDYEDVVRVDSFYYVLESNGNVHKVPANGEKDVETEIEFTQEKKIEFESLYVDVTPNRLVLVSKREINKKIIAYSFDITTNTFSEEPVYSIALESVHQALKDNIAEFKPSAAAINPVLNKLFLIASVGKVLVQCSTDGVVEKVYKLNPDKFNQPEGITFAPNGDMYISNEGGGSKATLLKFPYQK